MGVLHREGRFDDALGHFSAALEVYPDSALTEYCIAQIYIETGRAEEAKKRFDHIFAGNALGFGRFNIWALHIDYGFTLMLLSRFEEALPQLSHGLSLNEDVPHGLNALGYSFANLGQADEARGAFERGLHYDPENPYLLNNLAVTLMGAGQVQAGAGFLEKAVEAEPNIPAFAHNVRVLKQLVEMNQLPGLG